MCVVDSLDMVLEDDGRVEIKCRKCGGHTGHVFEPDHGAKRSDQRHCVNDSSIQYVKYELPWAATEVALVLPGKEKILGTDDDATEELPEREKIQGIEYDAIQEQW